MLTMLEATCARDESFRRRALRDAVMCLAWVKLSSITCYVALYFMIQFNTKEDSPWAQGLQIMVLAPIPPLVLLGILLTLGGMMENGCAICASLTISIMLAMYDIILGITGAIYFVHTGSKTMHFLIAVAFVMLAISFFPLLGNDWYIMYSYKKFLNS